MEKSRRRIFRRVVGIVVALLILGQVYVVLEPPSEDYWDVYSIAGASAAIAGTVVAIVLSRIGERGRAMLFWGPPVLATAMSPLVLLFLVGSLTWGDAGEASAEGFINGLLVGTLFWAVMGPVDQSGSPVRGN